MMNTFPALIERVGFDVSKFSNEKKIEIAEYVLRNMDGAVYELELSHSCKDGVYYRTVFLPKGMLLTGKTHNFDHMSLLSKGEVSIFTKDGLEHRKATSAWHSKAGTKRLILVHEDSIWTTSHITNETDLSILESLLSYHSDLSWIDKYKLLSGDMKCL
jgi:hypothetical protein